MWLALFLGTLHGGKKSKPYKQTLTSSLNKRILNGSNEGNKTGTKMEIKTLLFFMDGQVIDVVLIEL